MGCDDAETTVAGVVLGVEIGDREIDWCSTSCVDSTGTTCLCAEETSDGACVASDVVGPDYTLLC